MKIPMKKRPTVKEWAEQFGVDIHIAEMYQRARRRLMNRFSAFARKYGGDRSTDIPPDVRDLLPRTWGDFERYVEARAQTISNRASSAFQYLKKRQNAYLSNIITALTESNDYSDDVDIKRFSEWFNDASTSEKARLIQAIDANGGLNIIYKSKQAYEEEPEVRYDASGVIRAILEVL